MSFANWMAKRFEDRPAITPEAVQQAIQPFARRHSYDPVRTMLESVTWDGEQRAQHWLAKTFGSPDTPYVRAVALRFLISAVARIYAPGCKVDTVLALEGEQGLYKSSALRVLFGDRYFSDAAIDMASKDAAPLIRQCWCFELSEMTPTNRADVNVIKSFITRQTDRQRDAFARVLMDHPRRCVFVGTTNLSEYLRDATGGRRFWPVPVLRRGDLDWLRANRLQLWAEAVTAYKLGDPWWLTDEEEPAAAAEQEDRYIADDWEGAIAAWIERGGDLTEPGTSPSPMIRITGLQCYLGALAGDPATYRRETQTRISDCLRRLGWRRAVYRIDGRNVKGFIRSVAGPEVAS